MKNGELLDRFWSRTNETKNCSKGPERLPARKTHKQDMPLRHTKSLYIHRNTQTHTHTHTYKHLHSHTHALHDSHTYTPHSLGNGLAFSRSCVWPACLRMALYFVWLVGCQNWVHVGLMFTRVVFLGGGIIEGTRGARWNRCIM